MKVSIILGQQSPKIIESLSRGADNIKFYHHNSIEDLISDSKRTNKFFDRVVLIESCVSNPANEFTNLGVYLSEYSDNTSVVLICKNKDSVCGAEFSKILNSPIYTVAFANRLYTSMLMELVKSDIVSIRAKYNGVDEVLPLNHGGNTNTSEEKKPKKGLLSGLFGGFGNKGKNLDSQNNIPNTSEPVGNIGEMVSSIAVEKGLENASEPIPDSSKVESFKYPSNLSTEGSFISNNQYPISSEADNFNVTENGFSMEGVDLGIGELGGQHVDTGYLDESDKSDLDEFFAKQSKSEPNYENTGFLDKDGLSEIENSETVSKNLETVSESKDTDEDNDFNFLSSYMVKEESDIDKLPKIQGGINLVIGAGLEYIIKSSKSSVEKGERVLIVDLDTENNRVLSFISLDSFYTEKCNGGITKVNPYSEDSIDYMSNGYGLGISNEDVFNLISSDVFDNYDVVLIDCPVHSLSLISEELLSICKVTMVVEGNKNSMLSVLNKLTDRNIVSAKVEDLLFDNSDIMVVSKDKDFVNILLDLRKMCFFGRGNWLNKIS